MDKKNKIKLKNFFNESEELLKELIEAKAEIIYKEIYKTEYSKPLELQLNKNDLKYYLVIFYDLKSEYYDFFGGFEDLRKLYLYIMNNKLKLDLMKNQIDNNKYYIDLRKERLSKTELFNKRLENTKLKKELKHFKELNKYFNTYTL